MEVWRRLWVEPTSLFRDTVTQQIRVCKSIQCIIIKSFRLCKIKTLVMSFYIVFSWLDVYIQIRCRAVCDVLTKKKKKNQINGRFTWQGQTPLGLHPCQTQCSTFRWRRHPGSTGAPREAGCPLPWNQTGRLSAPAGSPEEGKERGVFISSFMEEHFLPAKTDGGGGFYFVFFFLLFCTF